MTTTYAPTRLTAGAPVAEYSGHGYETRATITTITRVTGRQVTVATGRRYDRNKHGLLGGLHGYGHDHFSLMDVDAPPVVNARARAALSNLGFRVHDTTRNFHGDRDAVLTKLAEIQALLDAAYEECGVSRREA